MFFPDPADAQNIFDLRDMAKQRLPKWLFEFVDRGTEDEVILRHNREVFDNIEAALPLMVAGGIICGDDAHHPPVIQAVTEHFGSDYRRDATLWIYEVM